MSRMKAAYSRLFTSQMLVGTHAKPAITNHPGPPEIQDDPSQNAESVTDREKMPVPIETAENDPPAENKRRKKAGTAIFGRGFEKTFDEV
jgi:hypothetical protein